MNAGLYAYDEAKLRAAIAHLRTDNAQARILSDRYDRRCSVAAGERVVPVPAADYASVLGVNDRAELARAAARMNAQLCELHMRAGVTIVDPATTYLEPDVTIAADAVIRPNTAIQGRSVIGAAERNRPERARSSAPGSGATPS